VDTDETRLKEFEGGNVVGIKDDAARFLSENFHMLAPSCIIIPAVPLHLAFEWIKRRLAGTFSIRGIPIPHGGARSLPHTWERGEDSLLVSYADFLCPEDCPEPVDRCTVTGKKRGRALFELLNGLEIPEYHIHVVRSRQMGPGIGGYNAGDLRELQDHILSVGKGKWIVGTACRCHGVLSAAELKPRENQQDRKLFGTPSQL